MRAGLAAKEPKTLEKWKSMDLYHYIQGLRSGAPRFVLHDGPPYANGKIHIGTALNKILKDIIVKFKTMQGFDSPYVPGWDTHGLPIEFQVTSKLGEKAKTLPKIAVRKDCRAYALRFMDVQREGFKRLGVRGDWENPYLTLHPGYEANVLRVLQDLVRDGNVYRSKKVVHWCPTCETALAEAEIEYHDEKSDSIYVKFPVLGQPGNFVIIWTTTPWTLPANMAIALHPDFEYVKVKVDDEYWILAKELLEAFAHKIGREGLSIVESMRGKDLEGLKTTHPFLDRESPLVLADYVTLETGTGCVHTAPGHGVDDYFTGMRYGLPAYSPVDHQGRFTAEVPLWEGQKVFQANRAIIEHLQQLGALVYAEKYAHSYPHCWRCKKPIIFRATEQWFISMDKGELRGRVLEQIDKVKWVPDWGKNRIWAMVSDRPDWCISRQRSWGIPIPAVTCTSCGTTTLSEKTLAVVIDEVEKHGTDCWFEKAVEDFLPPDFCCPHCGGKSFRKEEDILDVWIDSGSSFEGVLRQNPQLSYPADLYLEGSDQHRGWFNSSIFLSVARHGHSPYHEVVTHGFIRDGKGLKMSKSLGNVIHPEEVYDKYGADILRLWAASAEYRNDINISMDILLQQVDIYKKIRNTLRFLLGNLDGFSPETDRVELAQMPSFDRWALSVLHDLVEKVTGFFENYEFYRAMQWINRYIVTDLSAIYLDVLKDRLYVEHPTGLLRRSAQTVLFEILNALTMMLSPVLTFTSEEVYDFFPEGKHQFPTVQAERWPKPRPEWKDPQLEAQWQGLLQVREKVNEALERVRNEGQIGHSLDARVSLHCSGDTLALLQGNAAQLADLFIVSQVDVLPSAAEELQIEVDHAQGEKCPRCWKYSPSPSQHPKHAGVCPRCAQVLQSLEKE